MRPELLDPLTNADRLNKTVELIGELCRLHQEQEDYTQHLAHLGELVGQPIHAFDVDAAFRARSHETWARKLLFRTSSVPTNLTDGEMLELIERVRDGKGSEFQLYFWLECLWVNTGDQRIGDLILRPDEYFGEDDNSRELAPRDILDTALTVGKRARRSS